MVIILTRVSWFRNIFLVLSFRPKNQQKYCKDFCPEIFYSSHVASWKLFGTFCRLPYKWHFLPIPQKTQKSFRQPPGSYKKFQGRNPYNIFVAILGKTMTPKRHFEINWPLELQESFFSNHLITFIFHDLPSTFCFLS